MERQELLSYLKNLYELESQLYAYEQIEKNYNNKIEPLATLRMHPITYGIGYDNGRLGLASYKHVPYVYDEKKHKSEHYYGWSNRYEYTSAINECKKMNKNLIFKVIIPIIISLLILPFVNGVWMGIGILGVAIVISFVTYIKEIENIEIVTDRKIRDAHARCYREDRQKIADSEKPLRQHLEMELKEKVIAPKEETKALLNKLYSLNIIFPKYRNFVAISQIYEYMLSGRCVELEGPHGAYNLFEDELRHNIIIYQLDQIINKLDELNRIMNSVCNAIYDTNRLLSDINTTLGKIESNTALTAYNTQCVSYNTRIANQYNF